MIKYNEEEWMRRFKLIKEYLDTHDNKMPKSSFRYKGINFWSTVNKMQELDYIKKERIDYRTSKWYVILPSTL
jgi:hypothetical protein